MRVSVIAFGAVLGAIAFASPNLPTTGALALTSGRYLVHFAGWLLPGDPVRPPCVFSVLDRVSPSLHTILVLSRQGTDWVGVSEAPSESFRFVLRATGLKELGGEGIAGSAGGIAVHRAVLDVVPPNDVRLVAASDPIIASGRLSPNRQAIGEIHGTFRFQDSADRGIDCTTIYMNLQPAIPGV